MKHIGLIVLGALILIFGGTLMMTYNGMVTKQEAVENNYSNIETQLQRRADLIPNLISSVKGYMNHEKEVIASITSSREKLLNANGVQEAAKANEELNQALDKFLLVVENYPDLKSNENFIQLQDELAGTENRIATARRDYNNSVRDYNTLIKRIPGKFFADAFGFEKAEYFEASEESKQVPNVEF